MGKIIFVLCIRVIFATMSYQKDENFMFYIAAGEFLVLAHFQGFRARNVVFE